MALYLAERGFQVYATVRDMSGADALLAEAKSRNVTLRVMPLDVTNKASVEEGVATIVKECGGIYGVINNAGTGLRGYFEDLDDQDIRQMFVSGGTGGGVPGVVPAAAPGVAPRREPLELDVRPATIRQ